MTAESTCEHTHAIQPVPFPLYRWTPTPVLNAQTKEQQGRGAQDRESVWGRVSLGTHHQAASRLGWDSMTLRQTKLPAHRSLSFSHQYHWLLFSFISLRALTAILHICCYLLFALSSYCPIDSHNQIILEREQADEMHSAHH